MRAVLGAARACLGSGCGHPQSIPSTVPAILMLESSPVAQKLYNCKLNKRLTQQSCVRPRHMPFLGVSLQCLGFLEFISRENGCCMRWGLNHRSQGQKDILSPTGLKCPIGDYGNIFYSYMNNQAFLYSQHIHHHTDP